MESLRNEPVYLGGTPGTGGTPVVINTPSTGGNGYGENGLLSTVVLASLLGNRGGLGGAGLGTGDTTSGAALAYAQRAADNSSEMLAAIGKSEGDVKEAFNAGIHRMQIENSAHFSNLASKLCDTEKEAIKAGYEARIESLQTKSDLLANQNANTISIKDDIKDLRFDVDSKFCHLNNSMDKQFCDVGHKLEHGFNKIAERELMEENRRLRDKLDNFRYQDERRDINSIKHDVNRITCGLSKIPSPTATASLLDGCC
jgi:hypothetical protein